MRRASGVGAGGVGQFGKLVWAMHSPGLANLMLAGTTTMNREEGGT